MANFYRSDNDSYETPKEKGFHIGYATESGDKDYIGPYPNDMDRDEALKVLQQDLECEWYDGKFYARVTSIQEQI